MTEAEVEAQERKYEEEDIGGLEVDYDWREDESLGTDDPGYAARCEAATKAQAAWDEAADANSESLAVEPVLAETAGLAALLSRLEEVGRP